LAARGGVSELSDQAMLFGLQLGEAAEP
jgi:hypothetical protein